MHVKKLFCIFANKKGDLYMADRGYRGRPQRGERADRQMFLVRKIRNGDEPFSKNRQSIFQRAEYEIE